MNHASFLFVFLRVRSTRTVIRYTSRAAGRTHYDDHVFLEDSSKMKNEDRLCTLIIIALVIVVSPPCR
jgi:hypothetical protein